MGRGAGNGGANLVSPVAALLDGVGGGDGDAGDDGEQSDAADGEGNGLGEIEAGGVAQDGARAAQICEP